MLSITQIHTEINKSYDLIEYYKGKINELKSELKEAKKLYKRNELKKAMKIVDIVKNYYELEDNFQLVKGLKLARGLKTPKKVPVTNQNISPIYKAIKLAHNNSDSNTVSLSKIFNRNRTTINHALTSVDNLIETDKEYKEEYYLLLEKCGLKYKKFVPRKKSKRIIK